MMTTLKNFIIKHQLLFLFFLLWFIFFIFFYNGKIVIDTNFDLSVNPHGFFKVLFYGWSQTFYNGIDNAAVFSYIFPFGFLWWIFSFFVPVPVTESLVFSLILTLGFSFFSLFIQEELQTKSFYTYLGSLLYTLNMYTLLTFGTSSFLFPYIALPLQLYFLRKMILSPKYSKYAIGFGIATLLMSGVNPPFVGITLLTLFFYVIHIIVTFKIYKNYTSIILKLCVAGIISLGMNFFWILGDIVYYLSLSSNGFSAVLSESLAMQNSASTYLNVLRGLSIWSFGGEAGGIPYYNYSSIYLNNPVFILSLFICPFVVLCGWVASKTITRKYFVLFLLFIFSTILTVGAREGIFSYLYTFAYYHVPLFSMFRSSYKFTTVYYLLLAFFLSVTLTAIKNIKFKRILSLIILLVIILNAFPFFTGRVFEKIKTIDRIPQYYAAAGNFFDQHPGTYQILLLPVQYFPVYTWGFTAGNPESMWNKGLVARQGGSALERSNMLTLQLYDYLFHKNYSKANALMSQLNVAYIVQRNDFNWQYYKEISQPPAKIKDVLQPYKKVATYGKLDIYDAKTNSEILSTKNLTFTKKGPSAYVLTVRNISTKQDLSFLQSFHKEWKLFLNPISETVHCIHPVIQGEVKECMNNENIFSINDLHYLSTKSIFDNTHQVEYTYGNKWEIDPVTIKENYSKNYYKVNSDGSIDISLTLYFLPQLYLFIGLFISGGVILGSIMYITSIYFWRKYGEN